MALSEYQCIECGRRFREPLEVRDRQYMGGVPIAEDKSLVCPFCSSAHIVEQKSCPKCGMAMSSGLRLCPLCKRKLLGSVQGFLSSLCKEELDQLDEWAEGCSVYDLKERTGT